MRKATGYYIAIWNNGEVVDYLTEGGRKRAWLRADRDARRAGHRVVGFRSVSVEKWAHIASKRIQELESDDEDY